MYWFCVISEPELVAEIQSNIGGKYTREQSMGREGQQSTGPPPPLLESTLALAVGGRGSTVSLGPLQSLTLQTLTTGRNAERLLL